LKGISKDNQAYYDLHSDSSKISLNGNWEFCLDPSDDGYKKQYYVDFPDKNRTESVEVPSTYNLGNNRNYQGKAWYRKTVSFSNHQLKNKQAVIRFLGVALRCDLWVNGLKAGSNHYGWIPFELDITNFLVNGENSITVMVDNEILPKGIPDDNWDGWWNYGGIFRDVYVDIRPQCNVRNLYIDTVQKDRNWYFSSTAEAFNAKKDSERCTFSMKIVDDNNRVLWREKKPIVLEAGDNKVEFEGHLNEVELWTPETPQLYKFICQIEGDDSHTISIDAAFRQIETRDSQLLLNSKPYTIRGINIHEEYPNIGNALTTKMIEKSIESVSRLNANFIRTGHYTHHPYLYELCNKKGFMVWTEIPAWKMKNESILDTEVFELYAISQLKAMVDQYRKYPSIVIWSVGNEFSSEFPPGRYYVERTCNFVKSLDSTRLVTFASSRHRGPKPRAVIDEVSDLTFDIVDIIALNEYYGWYYGQDCDIGSKLDQINALYPGKPIVISEVGAGAAPDGNTERLKYHELRDYSLEHQCEFLKNHLDHIYDEKRKSFVAGAMIWVYADFHDPHRTRSTHPIAWNQVNLKGLVSLDRKEKPSYYVVKEFYNQFKD
jgi:beta-glucuronidase